MAVGQMDLNPTVRLRHQKAEGPTPHSPEALALLAGIGEEARVVGNGAPRIEGDMDFRELNPREAKLEVTAHLLPSAASHSFPSPSQSHLLSLKAAGGANMYVMNISSPVCGLAGEL